MTAWQDEHNGSPFGADAGRPTSRRAAREAERRAAETTGRAPETMVEKPPHPSGVVDFEAHDFGPEFVPDQAFDVGDTQDIWQALTRGAQPGRAQTGESPRFRPGAPEAPEAQSGQQSAMQGDLMDRVREAVLRRQQEPQAQAAQAPQQQRPAAFDSQSFDRRVLEQRAPDLQDSQVSQTFDLRGELSRRERRRRETADLREDGLPTELFDGRAATPAPQPAPQAPFDEYAEYERQYAEAHGRAVEQYDEDYYDEPYSPEPTIAIPLRAGAEPQRTDPVLLPQAFSEPAGDDALTFSSPVPQIRAEPLDHWAHAEADPEFIEPEDEWDDVPAAYAAQPKPASAPMPFIEPQQGSAFRDAQIGPPSEMTDLAGFEALIRKARQQPAGPTPSATPAPVQQQRPAMAWADDDADDVQDGFGSLLSRQVQSSHGTSPALILPNDPQPVDLTQAVSGTGDIFVTGTMKLSNRFSSTGASEDHYDSHDIDRLYDATQDEPAAGVAPVRASKAVSGASQNRVVTGKPGRGNLLPTVLAIVAGAMAVGVVTLLVGSWVFRIF